MSGGAGRRPRPCPRSLDVELDAKTAAPHLRHTFATEALASGISIFELARLMGASVKTIDKHYGHLARDSEAAILSRLEARAVEGSPQAEDA